MLKGHLAKMTVLAAGIGLALGVQAQQVPDRSQSTERQQQQDRAQSEAREVQRDVERGVQSGAQRDSRQTVGDRQSSDNPFDKLAEEHSNLSDFAEAIETAGLADSLSDGTSYTIFAPTNEAFSKERKDIDELSKRENRDELVSLLRAHIVADDLDLGSARELTAAQTIDGGEVELEQDRNGTLMVGNARLADTRGIQMGNIRVFPIDEVLEPNRRGSSPQASNRNDR